VVVKDADPPRKALAKVAFLVVKDVDPPRKALVKGE
jgi:hypothetical protein